MNIISNCCLAADIYQLLNIQYPHPLCWCNLQTNELANLVNNFENINFNEFELCKCNFNHNMWEQYKKECYNRTLGIYINKKIHAWYVHYIYDSTVNGIKKIGADIYSHDIFNFIIEKYKKRLLRFKQNDKPIYIFITGRHPDQQENNFIDFLEKVKNTKNKIYIFTSYLNLKKYENEFIKIIIKPQDQIEHPRIVAKNIIKGLYGKIL